MLQQLKLINNKKILIEKVIEFIKTNEKGYCCAVNANIVVEAYKNIEYFDIIKQAVFNTCDGINVQRIYNFTQKAKIKVFPGPDLFIELLDEKNIIHYFLGGQEKVLKGLENELKLKGRKITSENFYSPPFLPVDKFNYKEIASNINKSKPDIIWIGLGAPKQEIFMHNLLPFLDKGLMIGVGAAFNFYSGLNQYKRAPELMKRLHLEWLFRAFQEPNRIIKRQLKCLCYLPIIYLNEIYHKIN